MSRPTNKQLAGTIDTRTQTPTRLPSMRQTTSRCHACKSLKQTNSPALITDAPALWGGRSSNGMGQAVNSSRARLKAASRTFLSSSSMVA